MAEGGIPGAPQISGTQDDHAFFTHQPPPVEGVNFGSQSDAIDSAPSSSTVRPPPEELRPLRGIRKHRHERHHSADDSGEDSDSPDFHLTASPSSPASPASPVLSPAPSGSSQEPPSRRDSLPSALATPVQPETPRRAHFPSEPTQLARSYSAPRRVQTDLSINANGALLQDGEKDREPYRHRQGWWESCRSWIKGWKDDLGTPLKDQDVQDLIGDIGIDLGTIRKIAGKSHNKKKGNHNRVSSLIGPSVMLARPGLGARTESASTVQTTASGSSTTVGSGATTPGTLRKIFGSGVDAHELSHALKKLKVKAAKGDSKQAKYVQAKAELAHRRNLVLLMVYAFMAYGAPTHRIEEYTLQLLKALEMEGRVNYTVGCTEISFINPIDPADPFTRSAYTTIVKASGLDIGACEVVFHLYKNVVHGQVTVEEAMKSLTNLIAAPSYYKPWGIVPFYGAASALACIWAYGGYWMDMPIAFLLGCVVGMLQVVVAASNPLYSNVLEVTASLITSFGARAFASIGTAQEYFCFSSVAESSITTILPGYIVLCGTLELQSKSITAGSTRLFYAVIYSLLLGYGMAVGSQIWGAIYPDAPDSESCLRSVDPRWKILLVPSYLVVQAVLIRARPNQIPVQVLIGSAAYAVNYFVSQHTAAQVADTASALTLGVLGHLWARSRRAFAFAAVVAGIMVLVPSGLAAQGGLVIGLTTPLFNGTSSSQTVYQENIYQSFSVGAQMITVAVGLAVGIFVSALVVYPFGRKNNALFSF